MNEDSWMIIHIDKECGGFIRSPNFFKNVYRFKLDSLRGIHSLYLTIIAENWYQLDEEIRARLMCMATSKESIIYDMDTGGRIK